MKKALVAAAVVLAAVSCGKTYEQPELGARKVEIITEGKYQFKDLNKNGKLDAYEDWRLPMEKRIADLVSQMTLEEKAGLMFHPNIAVPESGEIKYDFTPEEKELIAKAQEEQYAGPVGPGGQGAGNMAIGQMMRTATAKSFIEEKNFRNILNNGTCAPKKFAEWSNGMQEIAEASRLGIPIMFSTDPRHGSGTGAHVRGTQYFSQFPSNEGQVGITAARDPQIVEDFGAVVAEEYRAVGLHMILGPQIDVMTEPRWGRNMGCFSESAELTTQMLEAFMDGAQGKDGKVGPHKILVHLKHWPGSGPHENGGGSWLVYPGGNQEYHYMPWKAGIAKNALAAMGYYSGTYVDTLNVNYSHYMSTEVLYNQLGFKGAICTDWGVAGRGPLNPRLQGKTTLKDNYCMIYNAGVDQIGSETHPEYIVELVKEGKLSEERVNQAASRILQWHFILGLFENPYVDPSKAEGILQSEKNQTRAYQAQLESNILLTNDGTLPAKEGIKLYVEGVSKEVAGKYATVVEKPQDADLILIRTTTVADNGGRRGGMGGGQGEVNIDFPAEKWANIQALRKVGKPIVVAFNPTGSSCILPPAVKTDLNASLMIFDVFDSALLDVVFGKFNPVGKLPFEVPSSMEAVRAQLEDVPFDSKDPTFKFDHGLSY